MPKKLTRQALIELARKFCQAQSKAPHSELFGVTDGKAVGTYVEHLFQASVLEKFDIGAGSSAKGIDLPAINTDIKVTSIKQPILKRAVIVLDTSRKAALRRALGRSTSRKRANEVVTSLTEIG